MPETAETPLGLHILSKVGGFILAAFGLLGSIFWTYALMDPAGSQLAYDADPFGTPPGTLESSLWLAAWLVALVAGCWLWLRPRKRQHRE